MYYLVPAQIESSWFTAKHWAILVFLHGNVWTFSHAVPDCIPNERNNFVSGAPNDKIAQTTSIFSNHYHRAHIHFPVVSMRGRYRLLSFAISVVETIGQTWVLTAIIKSIQYSTSVPFAVMANYFIVLCFFLITSALGPTVWYLWIYCNSANANFYFGATLAFASAQVCEANSIHLSIKTTSKSIFFYYRFFWSQIYCLRRTSVIFVCATALAGWHSSFWNRTNENGK